MYRLPVRGIFFTFVVRFCARKFARPANFFRGREFLSKMRVIFDPAALRAAVQLFLVISGL